VKTRNAERPSPVADRSSSCRPTVAELVETVGDVLSGLEDPTREARDLIAALLDEPRHWTQLHASDETDDQVWDRAMTSARKRAAGAPLAYAVGRANFRSLTLAVDERVLIPRPETELLVDLVLQRRSTGVAMDVGTGSGAIAIALAKEGKFSRVLATDISVDALEVARVNAVACGVELEFMPVVGHRSSDGSRRPKAEDRSLSVVVSNPPYIAYSEAAELPSDVRDWEPAVALFSGRNGLSATAEIVAQAAASLKGGGLLALEVDVRRASLVAELMASDGRYENVCIELDLTGRERFVLATRRGDG
jgi:release factor glutamine methyltransferase